MIMVRLDFQRIHSLSSSEGKLMLLKVMYFKQRHYDLGMFIFP